VSINVLLRCVYYPMLPCTMASTCPPLPSADNVATHSVEVSGAAPTAGCSSVNLPSYSEIWDCTEKAFGLCPCLWQIKVTEAILKRNRDVVSIAGMGMGKTLTFWMPLLFCPKNSLQIIVTPLNLLGTQNVQALKKAGYKAIFICADTATHENFQVCLYFLLIQCSQISCRSQAIANLKYQGVIITPEQLMKLSGGFEHLVKNVHFTSHITSVIFDEAHCISRWGSFCSKYKEVGCLHYMLPREIPIMITTVTLPPLIFDDVKNILQL